jgi:ABC-2 type transport system ATP-binding protein
MQTLAINKVTKKYGSFTALHEVDLKIEPGIFGLLGPNGAGKSTLMRILTTLQPADSGSIEYNGISWDKQHLVRDMIGYLPQKFSLYKHLKVKEALTHIAVLKGVQDQRDTLIQNVLRQVNLEEHQDKKIGSLSGGMVRRLGIAQAILGNPQIIVVDEPTAGLDPEERIRFRNILQTLGRSKIIIISSHIVEDIETVCEQAAILMRGKILLQGSIQELRQLAEGKIWTIQLPREEFLRRQNEWKIIRQSAQDDLFTLRVASDERPSPSAHSEKPTLEDAYFYFMQRAEAI